MTPKISKRGVPTWFLVFMLLASAFTAMVSAVPVELEKRDNSGPIATNSYTTSPHGIITGIILIVFGFILCFFGYRFFHLTMFIIGFYVGALLTYTGMTNGTPNSSNTLVLIISIVVGVIVGLLFVCCSRCGLWFVGGLGGYCMAVWFLSFNNGHLIDSHIGRVLFIIAFVIVGIILVTFWERTTVIIGTAFIGAYTIILGLDLFIHVGFAQAVAQLMGHEGSFQDSTGVYIMLGAVIVLFVVGAFVQFRYHRGDFGKNRRNVCFPWGRKGNVAPNQNRKWYHFGRT